MSGKGFDSVADPGIVLGRDPLPNKNQTEAYKSTLNESSGAKTTHIAMPRSSDAFNSNTRSLKDVPKSSRDNARIVEVLPVPGGP